MNSETITIITQNEDETLALGERLTAGLRPGMVLALQGDLGAGKTVISRGIARGLGVSEPVTSPTFTVVQEYQLENELWLFHLDMYRIDDEDSALAFGIEEYLHAPDAITLVEWPERIAGLLTAPGAKTMTAVVELKHAAEGRREITLPAWLAESLGEKS